MSAVEQSESRGQDLFPVNGGHAVAELFRLRIPAALPVAVAFSAKFPVDGQGSDDSRGKMGGIWEETAVATSADQRNRRNPQHSRHVDGAGVIADNQTRSSDKRSQFGKRRPAAQVG